MPVTVTTIKKNTEEEANLEGKSEQILDNLMFIQILKGEICTKI